MVYLGVNGLAVGLECRQGAASAYIVRASGQTLLNLGSLKRLSNLNEKQIEFQTPFQFWDLHELLLPSTNGLDCWFNPAALHCSKGSCKHVFLHWSKEDREGDVASENQMWHCFSSGLTQNQIMWHARFHAVSTKPSVIVTNQAPWILRLSNSKNLRDCVPQTPASLLASLTSLAHLSWHIFWSTACHFCSLYSILQWQNATNFPYLQALGSHRRSVNPIWKRTKTSC